MADQQQLDLHDSINSLDGVNEKLSGKFKRLKIKTIRDLLYHFPTRYEDYSAVLPLGDIKEGDDITVQGKISSIQSRRIRGGRTLVEATTTNDTGAIRAIWFNQSYITDQLPEGTEVQLSGTVSWDKKGPVLKHPIWEKTSLDKTQSEEEDKSIHTGGLVPIYPETKGLTSRGLRTFIYRTLQKVKLNEWIPSTILNEQDWPPINMALKQIHFPESKKEIQSAKNRFNFEDMFLLQLHYLTQKRQKKTLKAPRLSIPKSNMQKIKKQLPFTLTTSQNDALEDILEDIKKETPMSRLLYGDVGSGKTVVAILSALVATQHGYQVALMAPTGVLARQHYQTLRTLFYALPEEHQAVSALLTSEDARMFYESDLEDVTDKRYIREKIADGRIDILIGTHSLIQKNTAFNNLGLVIVDEQHRFGVAQRSALLRNDKQYVARHKAAMPAEGLGTTSDTQKVAPHFLSMSATPIPRTFMLSLFGDMDISIIDELPEGRMRPYTKVVPPDKREEAYKFVKEKLNEGRQAFVVCPRIELSDDPNSRWADVRAVEEEYEKLTRIFPRHNIEALHGRMESEEKQDIMHRLKNGDVDILVSTSVIEVGIDIPNATIMIIEGSELFGLAQLYQLRGRVGRGEYKSYCFLFYDKANKSIAKRLRAFVMSNSGFELAEKDLKLRGPGEFLGKSQSGIPDTIMKNLNNEKLTQKARSTAENIFKERSWRKTYPLLSARLERFEREVNIT